MAVNLKLYKTHKGQMRSADLIEWQSHTALGAAIRMVTRKKVNHSSILVRPKEYAGLNNRRFLLEALGGGLVPRLLSTRLREFKGRVWWYGLKDSVATQEDRDAMAVWAILEAVQGKRYDYGSLLKNILGRVNVDADAWFCSEAYTAMLMHRMLIDDNLKARRPGEFGALDVHIPGVLIYDSKGGA